MNYFGHTGDTGGDYLDDVEMPNIAGVSSQANIMVRKNNLDLASAGGKELTSRNGWKQYVWTAGEPTADLFWNGSHFSDRTQDSRSSCSEEVKKTAAE